MESDDEVFTCKPSKTRKPKPTSDTTSDSEQEIKINKTKTTKPTNTRDRKTHNEESLGSDDEDLGQRRLSYKTNNRKSQECGNIKTNYPIPTDSETSTKSRRQTKAEKDTETAVFIAQILTAMQKHGRPAKNSEDKSIWKKITKEERSNFKTVKSTLIAEMTPEKAAVKSKTVFFNAI